MLPVRRILLARNSIHQDGYTMPDLTNKLLPRLKNHHLPGLELPDEFIAPRYADQSILNIPDSICHWMNIPGIGEGTLSPDILAPLGNGLRRVILILMDGLALHRLRRWLEDGTFPVWRSLLEDGSLAPLTSISPSTTSAALTTLWSGRSPASHGILGYEVWLREYSMVANMILHKPMTFLGEVGSLFHAGFNPQTFLPVETFGPHLRKHGIIPYSFQHVSIAYSGLSQMFQKEVETQAFLTLSDLWISLRQMIEANLQERQYIWVYWSSLDSLSHRFGPDDERSAAEFSQFSAAFEHLFLNQLSPEARQDTLVLLTADHGQVHTPLDPKNSVKNHPDLIDCLHILPTGENRMAYLHTLPGCENTVRAYLTEHWLNGLTVFTSEESINAGLFGPGTHHPGLRSRTGDLIAFAHDGNYLWWADKKDFLLGRHGGLHRQEMLVPLLGARLG